APLHPRRAGRHLRLRFRRTDRRPVGHRPAAARVDPLPRGHRPAALRRQADRRGARVRPGVPRPPLRGGRQGVGHRLQLGQRRDAARRARALRRPRRRGDPAGDPSSGRRVPHRADRRDLHPRHGRVDGLRRRVRRRSARRAPHPCLPALRRLRRAGGDRRQRAHRRRGRVPPPAPRRRRGHPRPRLHPLPAADRRDLPGDGRRRHTGQLGRGVRQGRLQDAGAQRPDARGRHCRLLVRHHGQPGRVRDHRSTLPRRRAARGLPVRRRPVM
ncbi:MAG: Glutamate racemase, partial [uncultured Nocardioides sp.]